MKSPPEGSYYSEPNEETVLEEGKKVNRIEFGLEEYGPNNRCFELVSVKMFDGKNTVRAEITG